jgi:hypothetical protein
MRFSSLFVGCLMALALSGCAGYRLGPTNGLAAGERSVRIKPFSNHTMEPRLGDAVTSALRRNIQRDGTYDLETRDTADIVVTGVLKRYERHELSFVPKDVLTVRDYRVSLTAQVTARDAISGKTILDQEATGYTLVRVGSDLTSSERQAIPLLSDDLAKKITALLVDGSW